MKQLFILILLLTFGLYSCCDHNKDVPDKVLNSFTQMFPTATDVEWEMEDENEWEAEFEQDGQEMVACFNADGEWLETETEIESSELPVTAIEFLETEYSGWEIDEVEYVESPDFTGFEVELEKGDEEIEINFDESGQVIKIENENEEEEDED